MQTLNLSLSAFLKVALFLDVFSSLAALLDTVGVWGLFLVSSGTPFRAFLSRCRAQKFRGPLCGVSAAKSSQQI